MTVHELIEALKKEDPNARIARWEEQVDDAGIVPVEGFERVWSRPIEGGYRLYWLHWKEDDLHPTIVL